MNREIKFRAWHNEEGYMITSNRGVLTALQHCLGVATSSGFSNCNNTLKPERYSLMQYIGITDDNNKEIYEGDIVLVKNGIATDGTYKAKVLWFDEGCQWITQTIENDSGEWDVMQPKECGGFYEVVGNIYENPELLK